ncbi:hypothetical protein FZC83_01995 [Rossellomorea marisflavi]|uniref:Uncharacterized protein n=1 Tax=Rossellomorea marisflavi TaxID=189381 RepID=A0A5D4RYF4_9BACI|nr:hypothetical protein [Rossellomorea marisflavi]TYS56367.1 hypothetical protein FZC83_01995 [Rossellomorea marisflavi]
MTEFLRRLKQSVIKSLSMVIALVGVLIFTMFIAVVTIVLPMWLLSFVIDKYAALWIFALPLILMSGEIYKWFNWQFLEPFKK